MVVHFKHYCNTYGSLSAYIVAFFLRLSGGEALLGLPPLIEYPGYDADRQRQLFPFRTMAMLCSLFTLIGVSYYTKWGFESGKWAPQYDYFKCVINIPDDAVRVGEPSETGEQVKLTRNLKVIAVCVSTNHFYSSQFVQLSVMAGPMAKMYGAATMVGKDEMNGRINPAMEPDDDLPVAEAHRKRSTAGRSSTTVSTTGQGNTNF